ncbi:lipopolysaccharide biosynthesis protein [Fulvitalea axinellae]|uniref:Lipopolysaccharide biosynthesis protein n=1 Tax=Fulvitalea axinellae TaxID=1182444 RepID=A0AAU9CQ34_9BACT|nr:lipopolysaccharide biosynthesis protein [Fulvitalea axinellae]
MSELKKKGLKAFVWDFGGKLANQGVGFVISIFLARLLEPEEFGLLAMVNVVVGLSGVFMDVGLGGALVQRKRVLPVHYSSVFFFNLTLGLLLTGTLFFSADYVAGFYERPALKAITQVMAFAFLLNAFGAVQATHLRRELRYNAIVKAGVIAGTLSGALGVFLAFEGYGVWALVTQNLSGALLRVLLIWFFSQWTPKILFSFKALRQLWGFGFRMFLSGLLDAFFTRLDVMIIGKIFSPGILGYFQRAKGLDGMVVQYSSGSLMSVLFPVLSKLQNDLRQFRQVVFRSYHMLAYVVFLLLGGVYLVSEDLIVLLFTEKWMPSVPIFRILVLSGFVYPFSALLVNVLSGRGNSRDFLRLEVIKKVVMGINLLVGFYFGLEGYLYGLVLVGLNAVCWNTWFASREMGQCFQYLLRLPLPYLLLSLATVPPLRWLAEYWPTIDALDRAMRLVGIGLAYLIVYEAGAFALRLEGERLLRTQLGRFVPVLSPYLGGETRV